MAGDIRRRCLNCARNSGIAMRVFIGVSFIAGLVFLIFGCVVEFPVTAPPAVGMVVLGVFTMFASTIGCCGSFQYRRCLLVFMILQARRRRLFFGGPFVCAWAPARRPPLLLAKQLLPPLQPFPLSLQSLNPFNPLNPFPIPEPLPTLPNPPKPCKTPWKNRPHTVHVRHRPDRAGGHHLLQL